MDPRRQLDRVAGFDNKQHSAFTVLNLNSATHGVSSLLSFSSVNSNGFFVRVQARTAHRRAEKLPELSLSFDKWQRAEILAVQVKQIERDEDAG